MEKQLIGRDAGLPHSPAVVWRDLVFVSGQVGFLSGTREFEPGIEAQTRQALQNVLDLLAASGCEADGVLQMTVHDRHDRRVRRHERGVPRVLSDCPPSRTTVGISHLGRPGLKIEIDAIAARARWLPTPHHPPEQENAVMIPHLIDGKPVESPSVLENINPATGEVLAEVALGGEREVALAVAAAKRSLPWAGLPARSAPASCAAWAT